MTLCGGISDEINTDQHPELVAALTEHLAVLNSKAGSNASKMHLVSYKTQVVSGTNYFAKLRLDDSDAHIHARIFQGLPHTGGKFEVHDVQKDHTKDSALTYF